MQAVEEMNAPLRPAPASTGAVGRTMRAIVHRQYGEPGVLAFEEIARPVPGAEEVLVRVHAAGANVGDHHVVTGKPYLIRLTPFGGLPRPRNRVPGATLAGVVEAVGANVTMFRPGDEVFGQAANGAFAEYVAVPEKQIAPRPSNLSFEEAAAVPWAATALQGLRAGGVVAGQRVLINGASGGVGTWAVQIAKALGAEVTAVCSTRNVEGARALGAAEVIDYTKADFVEGGARFDVMLDMIGDRSLSECRSVLVPRGTYVACAGGSSDWFGPLFRLVAMLFTSIFTSRRLTTFVMAPDQKDLLFLKELVESGKAKPVIERRYPLREVAEALRHVGEGHAQGQTVIRIAG
jgi:NADPH:quinone reductase-like Zn-dependent oxidoreductase